MNDENIYFSKMPPQVEEGRIFVDWGVLTIVLKENNHLWVEFWIK